MKMALLVVSIFAFTPRECEAAPPSYELSLSCLYGQSAFGTVKLLPLPTSAIDTEEDYSGSYDAKYLIRSASGDVGYATRGEVAALIYRKKVYPLSGATPLSSNRLRPDEFNPFLAEWSEVSQANDKFLCVSFPVGALGLSGRHQHVRGAFLLSLKASTLYYAEWPRAGN
jgi:hypothetical protein